MEEGKYDRPTHLPNNRPANQLTDGYEGLKGSLTSDKHNNTVLLHSFYICLYI